MTRRIKDLRNRIKHKIAPLAITGKAKETLLQNKEPKTLQAIKSKLAQNALVELRLGFDEVEFHSKRDVQALIRVLQEQFLYKLSLDKHSCLKSISIGWKLPSFAIGPIFQQVIPILLQEPIRITHIHLALRNTPVPEDCLRRIVSWSTLEYLEIRSVRVMRPLAQSERIFSRSSGNQHHSNRSENHQHHSHGNGNAWNDNNEGNLIDSLAFSLHPWKSETIVRIIPHISLAVKTLKLVDCGLRKQQVVALCEVIRRKLHRLQELSLRHNRDLDGGYNELFSLPCIKKLDLSLCDLNPHDGLKIAKAMEKHLHCGVEPSSGNYNHYLQGLKLSGNYRMAETVPDIVRVAASRLVELNCSFCDVQNKIQRKVFHTLTTTPNCTLQSFSMQGTRINRSTELLTCIRENTSLRRLVLDHPREPFPLPKLFMQRVSDAMKDNYSLCVLQLDSYKCEKIWEEMEFWFQLNRCGRRVLLQDNKQRTSAWSTILSVAAQEDDLNVMFWLLKHGSVMFAS